MPKKKVGKHLQFYMDCIINNSRMPFTDCVIQGGLCSVSETNLISKRIFKLFSEDQRCFQYWADETRIPYENRYKFNTLRQTIVLFMAAINNEL